MENDPYSYIRKWAKTPTWNTSHALDIERFNRALRDTYDAIGNKIDIHEISATLTEHAGTPIWPISKEEREEAIQRCVERAEAVIDYLRDTSGRRN